MKTEKGLWVIRVAVYCIFTILFLKVNYLVLKLLLIIGALIFTIITMIYKEHQWKKYLYKTYKKCFESFKVLHMERYKAYLSCNQEKIKGCTELMEIYKKVLLKNGEKILSYKYSKKIKDEVKEIMVQTQVLVTTICPT